MGKRKRCVTCSEFIDVGAAKLGNRYRGPYNRGPGAWKIDWHHLDCVSGRVARLTQLQSWERLRFCDQKAIDKSAPSKRLKLVYGSAKLQAEIEKADELLWKFKALLSSKLKPADLQSLLKLHFAPETGLNGCEMTPPELEQRVADWLLHGLPEDCPACGKNTLSMQCGRMVCNGWMSAFSQCKYRGPESDSQRYGVPLPEGLEKKLAWVDPWIAANGGRMAPLGDATEEANGDAKKRKTKGKQSAAKKRKKTGAAAEDGGSEVPIRLTLPTKPISETAEADAASSVKMEAPTTAALSGSEILTIDPKAKDHVPPDVVLTANAGVEVFHVMLTKVDLLADTNSFYRIQLIEKHQGKDKGKVVMFMMWGKVSSNKKYYRHKPFAKAAEAMKAFKDKFKQQTGNKWEERYAFVKKPNKYSFVELSRGEKSDVPVTPKGAKPLVTTKSTLSPQLQKLVELLWDENTVLDYLKSQDIDVRKLPLGQLSNEAVRQGLSIMGEIETILRDNERESTAGTARPSVYRAKLHDACTRFFTAIPTNKPKRIESLEIVQQMFDMLNVLGDIALAQELLKGGTSGPRLNPLDEKYHRIGCKLTHLSPKSKNFKTIKKYMENTASPHRTPTIIDVFEMDRNGETAKFREHEALENRKLLWHGTNVAVAVAICSGGLRIMPHSGGRVGRGLYFASENGKSSSYVQGTKNGTAIMFLAEVALGDEHHITKDDSSLKEAPKGFHSIVAQGRTEPKPAGDVEINLDGHVVTVPTGKPTARTKYSSSNFSQTEYLVYKESQVRLRYLLKLQF